MFCLQPCFAFAGDQFESVPEMRLAKSLLIDAFRGQEVDTINLKVLTLATYNCCLVLRTHSGGLKCIPEPKVDPFDVMPER